MVDSVVMVVFKSTAKWLFNKGKKHALNKLQDSGDAIDQSICRLIADELDEIKSELKAARVAPLITSFDLYNEGLKSVSFDDESLREPLQKKMKIRLDDLDGSAAQTRVKLSDVTKQRFKDARLKAGDALGNQKLEIKEIILAYYVKIMATLLENADNDPARARAISFSKGDLEKMNSLPKIYKAFSKALTGSPWEKAAASAYNAERAEVIRLSVKITSLSNLTQMASREI